MSIRIITKVLDLAPAIVTPSERLVLLALAWHADEHGRNAWPAVSTLCRKTSLCRRSVQMILPKLKQKGLVYVQSVAARRSVRYAVDLATLDRAATAQSKPHNDCAPAALPRAATAPSQRNHCAPPAQPLRPIRPLTVREPSVKKLPGAVAPAPPTQTENAAKKVPSEVYAAAGAALKAAVAEGDDSDENIGAHMKRILAHQGISYSAEMIRKGTNAAREVHALISRSQ